MTTGSPIDPSLRRVLILPFSTGHSVPDSKGNLDPAPQLVMTPGDEQFAFQYPDGLGDGREQYTSYPDAGGGGNDTSADVPVVNEEIPGLTPTLPGDPTVFLDGSGGYSIPPASGQSAVQYEDEGSALGSAGSVDEFDVVGAGATLEIGRASCRERV